MNAKIEEIEVSTAFFKSKYSTRPVVDSISN